MKPLFFHDLRSGQCKFITGTAPLQIARYGVAHMLATACGAGQQPGSVYCTHHRALTAGPPRQRIDIPRDMSRQRAPAPQEQPEPDLCDIVGAA